MKQWSHVNSAVTIIKNYAGQEPFASFIKKYFAQHKKYGSKDRRQISHLCYCYFRLGKTLMDRRIEEKILAGLFLCSSQTNEILQELKPEWNKEIEANIDKKLKLLDIDHSIRDIFPFTSELSVEIEIEKFVLSHLQQPDLFLRLRPGKEIKVKQKLQKAGISFDQITDTCIALPNSSKIDDIIELNKEAVVQDYSSQRVGELLAAIRQTFTLRPSVWDCCAASGGKSIMAKDILEDIDLTVSDIRKSILVNLKQRFKEAEIKNYNSFVADLSRPYSLLIIHHSPFNLIICDAPCSGSGTWSRTPEQLYYFEKNKIDYYVSLQQQIVSNTISYVKPGGYFLYITCSVYKKENEDQVEFIKENFRLDLTRMELLKGYDKKADTLFNALFRKPL